MSEKQHDSGITGVFSTQEVRKVGTGTTTRKSIQKSFWFCQQLTEGADAGSIEVQPLNSNYIPSGPKRVVEKDTFLSTFAPEPEFYMGTVYPKIREMNKTIARAERHRANGEHFSAEMEFGSALKIDEENVRANFGLGLTYMERGENAKAEDILGRLVKLEAAFEPEHKHLFNEFGIQLRKNGMNKDSIAYYARALELSQQDENLFYNIARACLEDKQPDKAAEYLIQGLELNPNMDEILRFLMWLVGKKVLSSETTQKAMEALKVARAKVASGTSGATPATPAPAPEPASPEETGAQE